MGKIKIKVDNLTYSLSTDGWIHIYDGVEEIAQVEICSEEESLYSYRGCKFLNGRTHYI